MVTFRALLRLYRPNPSQTLEQQRTNKFLATTCSVPGQAFVAVIYLAFAFTGRGSRSTPIKPSSRLRFGRMVAIIAASVKTANIR